MAGSGNSIIEATRWRSKASAHGASTGAAGFKIEGKDKDWDFLSASGQKTIINPHEGGYGVIQIGAAWDMMRVAQKRTVLDRVLGRTRTRLENVDLDLGCLYEMKDGTRGALQAFGALHGDFDNVPFMRLSRDEREGDEHGFDEHLDINGACWPDIKKLIIYVYIYGGAPHWASVRPQIQIRVPNEKPMIVSPAVHKSELAVCVIGSIENVRDGIKLENFTEYFPGHPEMDRAFGWGLQWEDGHK